MLKWHTESKNQSVTRHTSLFNVKRWLLGRKIHMYI